MKNKLPEKIIEILDEFSEHYNLPLLSDYYEELKSDDRIISELEFFVKDVSFFQKKKWKSVDELGLYRIFMYCLVRVITPNNFIETGVLHGLTSKFILSAMLRNNEGKLYSIDFPSYFESGPANNDGYNDTLPPNKEPGWVISEKENAFWILYKGSSKNQLPVVLAKQELIDLFLHDSEHTYDTMYMEMQLAWTKLKLGGFLICDNIDANTSFFDFCRKEKTMPFVFPELNTLNGVLKFGVIQKVSEKS